MVDTGLYHLNRQVTDIKQINCLRGSMKFQAPKNKFQTNPNNLNSKFQTNNPHTVLSHGTINGRPDFAKRGDTTLMNVLVTVY
jgi:hypothetical protein